MPPSEAPRCYLVMRHLLEALLDHMVAVLVLDKFQHMARQLTFRNLCWLIQAQQYIADRVTGGAVARQRCTTVACHR